VLYCECCGANVHASVISRQATSTIVYGLTRLVAVWELVACEDGVLVGGACMNQKVSSGLKSS